MDWVDKLAWNIIVEQNVLQRDLEHKDFAPLSDFIRGTVAEHIGDILIGYGETPVAEERVQ